MSHPLIAAIQPGFHYFPLAPGTKKPAFAGINWGELSTTNLETIETWVERGYNLGVDCQKSDLIVIDLDGDEGRLNWENLSSSYVSEPLLEVKTPHGRHIYFHGSAPSSVSKLANKIDVRSRGGYVVAAGSKVDGAQYFID